MELITSSEVPAIIHATQPRLINTRRKVNLLAYDPTGLRTTKTVTWAAVDKSLEDIKPNHLPAPEWYKDYETLVADHERRGLPLPNGRRMALKATENYNVVRW